MSRATFFTNHMRVLTLIADKPDVRIREIASQVGITERAAHRIVSELIEGGYLSRERNGIRNQYTVERLPSVEPAAAELLERMIVNGRGDELTPRLGSVTRDFHAVFDAVPVGLALADASGRILAANPRLCELLGRGESELVGRGLSEHLHPDDLAEDEERIAQIGSRAIVEYTGEKRYVRGDGALIRAKVRVARVLRHGSAEPLLVVHVTEIDERARKRLELDEAEERFRSAFDNAPIGLALLAPDGRWLKVNRAMCEITGYSETALLTRTFQSITHADDLAADLEFKRQVLAGERRTYQMDKRYYHADGHVIWISLSVSLVRDPSGEPLYFISQLKDITERKQAEHALALSEARLAALFRYIPASVSLRDLDGRYLHVTESVAAALGCTPEDAVGRHPSEHLQGEALSQVLADDAALLAGSGPIYGEVTARHADGTDHDYYVLKWPVHDENGGVAALGAFSLDITAGKPAEDRMRELLEAAR